MKLNRERISLNRRVLFSYSSSYLDSFGDFSFENNIILRYDFHRSKYRPYKITGARVKIVKL